MEIAQYATQLAAFQKPFDCFKEMAIFYGVTYEDIKESFQATIWYTLTFFRTNVANPVSSIVIKEAKTKINYFFFLKCILKKAK